MTLRDRLKAVLNAEVHMKQMPKFQKAAPKSKDYVEYFSGTKSQMSEVPRLLLVTKSYSHILLDVGSIIVFSKSRI
jgi:hypothetical protein